MIPKQPFFGPNQTPGNALWHSPELLTSILSFVVGSYEGNGWTKDVAPVLQTSKYGLEIGSGVLYESEKAFPGRDGRMDMLKFLSDADCPVTRVKMYLSKLKRLDYYTHRAVQRRPADAEMADVNEWLLLRAESYPSVEEISLSIQGALVHLDRDPTNGHYTSMTISDTRACRSGCCATSLPTKYKRLNFQLGMREGMCVPVLKLDFPAGNMYYDCCLTLETILELKTPTHAYTSLKTLDLGGTPLQWSLLVELLLKAPALESLTFRSDDTKDPWTFAEYDDEVIIAERPLKQLDVTLATGNFSALKCLLRWFCRLQELKVQCAADGVADDEIMGGARKSLRKVEIIGRRYMDAEFLSDLVGFAPNLESLKVQASSLGMDKGVGLVQKIAAGCPNLRTLHVDGSEHDYLPFPSAINDIILSCPALKDLSIPVTFHPVSPMDLTLPLPNVDQSRWSQLTALNLLYPATDPCKTAGLPRPPSIWAAFQLHQWVDPHTTLSSQRNYHSETTTERLRAEYWWIEVGANVSFIRAQGGGVGDELMGEAEAPGWRMLEKGGEDGCRIADRMSGDDSVEECEEEIQEVGGEDLSAMMVYFE